MKKRWLILGILFSYFTAVVLSILIGGWFYYDPKILDKGITSTIYKTNGEVIHDDNVFNMVDKNDVVVFDIPVPLYEDIKHPSLCFYYYNSAMNLYFEDELIKTSGFDKLNENKHIGTHYEMIEIPKEAMGKKLKLELVASENNAFHSFDNVQVMESTVANKYVTINNVFRILMDISVLFVSCLLGSALFFFSMIKKVKTRALKVGEWLSILLFTLAIYTLGRNGGLYLFSFDDKILGSIEYISLFFLPIPLSLYFYNMYKNTKVKKAFKLTSGYFIFLFVTSTILNFTSGIHYNSLIKLLLVSALVGIPFSYYLTKNIKLDDIWAPVIRLGVNLSLLTIGLDIVIYLVDQLSHTNLIHFTLMPLGMIILLASVIFGLAQKGIKSLEEHKENEVLSRLAYVDELTGLSNRTKSYKVIDEIRLNKLKDFVVLFVDLNNLKTINDKYGHNKGDEYIKRSAYTLKKVFSDSNVISRFGGDEFLIIYVGVIPFVEERIRSFYYELEKTSACANCEFKVSAAIGYAISTKDNPKDIYDVIHEADKNMYINKEKIKNNR